MANRKFTYSEFNKDPQADKQPENIEAANDQKSSTLKSSFNNSATLLDAFHKNFELVHADTPALRQEAYRLRYLAYCEENAFEDPAQHPDKIETDNYEDNSQHMLLKAKKSGVFIGTIRAVRPDPDTGRLPLHETGQNDILNPIDNNTVEISRNCLSRQRCEQSGVSRSIIMNVAMPGLLQGAFIMSQEAGAKHWVGAMEPVLITLLRRKGVEFPVLSEPFEYHGQRQIFKMNCWNGLKACLKNNPKVGTLMQPDQNWFAKKQKHPKRP